MLGRSEVSTNLLVSVPTRKKVLHITRYGIVNAVHVRLPPNFKPNSVSLSFASSGLVPVTRIKKRTWGLVPLQIILLLSMFCHCYDIFISITKDVF
jgi:hypothetical protein